MDVLTPRSLDEALRSEGGAAWRTVRPGRYRRSRRAQLRPFAPAGLINLNEVAELRGWSRENGNVTLGAGLTYTEAMAQPLAGLLPALAEASRTVGSPQIRNRGTIGGNLGTASPAGDALPPLLVEGADIELASVRGSRRLPLQDFLLGVSGALSPTTS